MSPALVMDPPIPTMTQSILNRKIKFTSTSPMPHQSYSSSLNLKVDKRNEIHLNWIKTFPIGPGLHNMGNTCFMNSVLQCISYTPPLANFLIAQKHECTSKNACTLYAFQIHVHKCFNSSSHERSIVPKSILSKIKWIAKHFRLGRQEDAHEFMIYLFDAFQKPCSGKGKLTGTDIIKDIFCGHVQSQVKCMNCKNESNKLDPFYDLSLEVKNSDSLEKALSQYTKSEFLTGQNRYKCERCKKTCDAQKRMSIKSSPPVLAIQLKRFGFSKFGSKISKFISFKEVMDMSPFMTDFTNKNGYNTPNNKSEYQLNAVLVHSGGTCSSGHYYCFVRNSNNIWYRMDDSDVSQVSLKTVLSQQAYMLFYVKKEIFKSTVGSSNKYGNGKEIVKQNHELPTPVQSPILSNFKSIKPPTIKESVKAIPIIESVKPSVKASDKPISIIESVKPPIESIKSSIMELKKQDKKKILKAKYKLIATDSWNVCNKKEWQEIHLKKSVRNMQLDLDLSTNSKEAKESTEDIKQTSIKSIKAQEIESTIPISEYLKSQDRVATWNGPWETSETLKRKSCLKRTRYDDIEYDRGKLKKLKNPSTHLVFR